jgi:hypothetical protein
MLIPSAVLQHESQIIQIGRDVSGVYRIEVLHLVEDFPSCVADGIGNVVGDFLLFLCMEAEGEEKKEEQ